MLSLTPAERLTFHERHINEILAIWEYTGATAIARAAGAE